MTEQEEKLYRLAMDKGIFIRNMDEDFSTIKAAQAERVQLEMGLQSAVEAYNDKTGAQITAFNISYSFCSALQKDLPNIHIEVKI